MSNKKEIKAPWYSFYNGVRTHLNYPDYGLYQSVKLTSEKYPNYVALNYFGNKTSYRRLIQKIDECAKSLKALGLKKEDKVTICMPNTPEAVIAFYAINKIGAVANVIHPLSAENEIKHALNLSKSKMIIAIDLAWKKLEKVLPKTKVKNTIIVSVMDSMPIVLGLGYFVTKGKDVQTPSYTDNVMNWKTFINKANFYNEETYVDVKGKEEAVILYSGGTTGTSKGIVLTNLNFNALGMQCYEACVNFRPGMSVLSILPIFHGFGLGICIHTVLSHGLTGIILPQFDAKSFDKLLKKYKPNAIVGVPTLFEALMLNKNIDDMDLSFVKCAISGGDNISASLKEKIDSFLKEHNSDATIREGYGLTECVAASCLMPYKEYRPGSIGIPIPDMYFKIVKIGTTEEVPFGKEGEITISGPTVMKEYLDNKEETKETLRKHKDGRIWLHTGDLGTMSEEGFVYFSQRLKRMIVSSGYNLYPSKIEKVIEELPFVLKSCVIGVPHSYKVEVAKAFVVLKEDVEANESIRNEIFDHCVKNLAKYSLPYEIEFIEELPKTKVNKIDYRKLEEQEKKKRKK